MQIKNIGYLLFCVSGISMADNVTVYRWVDKNNVVHFSQYQPGNDNFTELSMSNVVRKQTELEEKTASDIEKSPKAIDSKDKCEAAKANVRTLKAFDKIQYTNEKGSVQVLSELEKKQQLEINQKQVEVYCQ